MSENTVHTRERESVSEKIDLPDLLILLPVEDLVLFPGIITPVAITDEQSLKLVEEVLNTPQKLLAVSLKKESTGEEGTLPLVYEVGCAATILKMLRIPDGTMRLLMQGIARIRILQLITTSAGWSMVRFEQLISPSPSGLEVEALMRQLKENFSQIIDASPHLPNEMKVPLLNITDPGALCDFIAANLNLKPEERQEALQTIDIQERLRVVMRLVTRELDLINISTRIQKEVSGSIEKSQREYFLREQLKAIKKELGEEEEGAEIKKLRERLENLKAPERVKEVAQKEIDRLATISPASAEYTVARTYIDWLLELPWEVSTQDTINLTTARQILERDHYGLEDVKERILEILAVRKLKGEGKGSILCFVGPPGVGKTSIGRSIAEAMGRKFVRMSLGGLRDEAEIRGHRRTYIGALPGRIIQNIRRAGTNNPVFMLDEIDKLGTDFRGDPASAMLEVLDPEQNFAFQDNYLELDFDLSKVLFITTANYLETIPPPLRDRMEVIKLPGYITPEKVEIARRYLVPRQIKENGLNPEQVKFTQKALEDIVIYYTREAGVRTLERTIAKVCRKIAVKVAEDSHKGSFLINSRNLERYLGSPTYLPDLQGKEPRVGVATGLAWTPVGGVLLQIEAIAMPGEGKLIITGRLGEVMRESAEIAMSYLRACASDWGLAPDYFKTHDFHIHIPEGATPKDGPSAGITITTALASLFTGRPVRHDVAMTGEITLQGRVLPIGGLREKSVAAARAHMKMVICPKGNQSDLSEIPEVIRKKLQYLLVESIDEVLKVTLIH